MLHSPTATPPLRRATLMPTQCEVCRRWGNSRLCPACTARHAATRSRCARCGLPTGAPLPSCGNCQAEPLPFEHTVVALDYGWPWDRLITAFKFQRRVELAKVFGELMADAVRSCPLPSPQLIVPVPLAPQGQRVRGFNQAWELAREVARRLDIDACAEALDRIATSAAHQVELGRAARLANLRAAFVPRPRHAALLQRRRVLLVDDVMTTGATAREAAAALLRGGAIAVDVLVLARTEAPSDADAN